MYSIFFNIPNISCFITMEAQVLLHLISLLLIKQGKNFKVGLNRSTGNRLFKFSVKFKIQEMFGRREEWKKDSSMC